MAAGSTYTPIATQTLGSAAASVTFSSISGAYTDLILICNGKTSSSANNYLQFNSDTGSNYSATRLSGNGTAADSARDVSINTKMLLDGYGFWTSTYEANKIIQIMNYSNSTTYKTVLTRANTASQGTDALVGLWRSTAAITSVKFLSDSNIQAGSTFTLYGIAAA